MTQCFWWKDRGQLPGIAGQSARCPSCATANGTTNKTVNCHHNQSGNVAPVSSTVGEMTTGVMLATGFTTWGWGYGLGWSKPGNHLFTLHLQCTNEIHAKHERSQVSSYVLEEQLFCLKYWWIGWRNVTRMTSTFVYIINSHLASPQLRKLNIKNFAFSEDRSVFSWNSTVGFQVLPLYRWWSR